MADITVASLDFLRRLAKGPAQVTWDQAEEVNPLYSRKLATCGIRKIRGRIIETASITQAGLAFLEAKENEDAAR